MANALKGKVALVTGGSRGLGAVIATALAAEGVDIAISYVASAEKADAVVEGLTKTGVRAIAIRAIRRPPVLSSRLSSRTSASSTFS